MLVKLAKYIGFCVYRRSYFSMAPRVRRPQQSLRIFANILKSSTDPRGIRTPASTLGINSRVPLVAHRSD